MYKFKYGDKVKVVSHSGTVAHFGGDSVCLADIGTEGIVNMLNGESVGITGEMLLLHADDLILLENTEQEKAEIKSYNPLVAQEGGGHYKDKGIQPLEYTMKNNLSFCEGNVVKYISRYKSKNGIEDLAKVIHYALLASYEEYGEQGSTELKEKVLKLLGVTE